MQVFVTILCLLWRQVKGWFCNMVHWGDGSGEALRSYAALRRIGMGFVSCFAFFRCLADSRRILAPLGAAVAAVWLPPAAKEGQGDCDFPLGPPWILLYPLKRRRSAVGLEAAERRVLTRRSAAGAMVCVALRSSVVLWVSRRRPCAAFGCGSSLVTASGGQGGPGGLRFPPRPSLDSPLPLETPPLR